MTGYPSLAVAERVSDLAINPANSGVEIDAAPIMQNIVAASICRAPQFGGLYCANPIENRSHRHEQQRLVQNMRECVGRDAIDREGGSDTNAHNHETQLVIQGIGQHSPQIVFNCRID